MIALLFAVAALASPLQDGGGERARPEILDKLRGIKAQEDGAVQGRVITDERSEPLVEPPSAAADEPAIGALFRDAMRCWLELEPTEVEIGEPIELTLHVVYPPGIQMRVKDEALQLDDSWVVLEQGRVVTVDDPPNDRTRARWVVASLEPGERELELKDGRYEAWGTLYELKPEPARVRVRPALAADEDEPRPAAGFREPPDGAEPSLRPAWIAGGALLTVVAASVLVALRARRRRTAPVLTLAPRERLARLDGEGLDDPQRVRALVFELCSVLRELEDERAGSDRRGATDEEWLAAVVADPGLTSELHGELASFMSKSEAVKYGQERPTRWAAEEMLTAARALGERLAEAAR